MINAPRRSETFEASKLFAGIIVTVAPAMIFPCGLILIGGKAFTGKGGLVFGHERMNGAARLYTSLKRRGMSNGAGNGIEPVAALR